MMKSHKNRQALKKAVLERKRSGIGRPPIPEDQQLVTLAIELPRHMVKNIDASAPDAIISVNRNAFIRAAVAHYLANRDLWQLSRDYIDSENEKAK